MLKIFGKNNNRLFRNSKKQTYSMPQSLSFDHQVRKCACGHDFIAIVTTANSLYFLYQATFYPIHNLIDILDVATSDNTVTVITLRGEVLVWDFDYEKVQQGSVHYTTVKLTLNEGDIIQRVEMGENDIFLLSQDGKVYHFKRNKWYETKTYSNIESLELSQKIVDISAGINSNLFLTYEGQLLSSSKQNPLYLQEVKTSHKFIKVSASTYSSAITKKGVIMIWGNSIHGSFSQPTQFYKLTKKFVDITLDQQNGFAIADDGQIWVWGINQNGQLGLSDYETRTKPFPLITLQGFTGIQIFSRQAYTCCLCYPNQKNGLKVIQRKKETFRSEQNNQKISPKKTKKSVVFDEKSIKKQRSKSPSPLQLTQTDNRNFRSISKGKKSDHRRDNSMNKSITPKCKNTKKQIFSKSHRKTPSKSSTKQDAWGEKQYRKNHKRNFSMKQDEGQYSSQWNEQTILAQQQQKWNKQAQIEISELKKQNEELKQKVKSQGCIINDITKKIRLLQEAIEEYQKNLTSRDNVVQEFEQKEQQYISHINDLQAKIDQIVKSVNQNNDVTVIYENMKEDFDKEREYYLEKLKTFQQMLNHERDHYRAEIQELKSELRDRNKRSILAPKQNVQPSWDSQSPINRKNDFPQFKKIENSFTPNGRTEAEMEQMIEKIENNKSRINKSANKLIAMLDMSS